MIDIILREHLKLLSRYSSNLSKSYHSYGLDYNSSLIINNSLSRRIHSIKDYLDIPSKTPKKPTRQSIFRDIMKDMRTE
jgi:hypothetical protein